MFAVINDLHVSVHTDARPGAEPPSPVQRIETPTGADAAAFYSGREFVTEPEGGFTWLPGHA